MPADTGLTGGNGKGDSPRSCFSQAFRDNYDAIDWGQSSTFRCKCGSVRPITQEYQVVLPNQPVRRGLCKRCYDAVEWPDFVGTGLPGDPVRTTKGSMKQLIEESQQ